MSILGSLFLVILAVFSFPREAWPTMFPPANLPQKAWRSQEADLLKKMRALRLPEAFVQKPNFLWSPSMGAVAEVVYGNMEMGFFSTKNFLIQKNSLQVTLIPPTYLSPIEFRVRFQDPKGGLKTKTLGKKLFQNPLKGEFSSRFQVESKPSFPFIIINWVLGDASDGYRIFPLVFNRLGEVVWIYYDDAIIITKSFDYAFDVVDDGRFVLMNKYRSTRLMILSSFGEIKKDISFLDRKIPYGNSHSVQYLPATNEIVFLSFDCRRLKWWQEFVPLFDGPMGWWRLVTLPRRTYRGSKLIRMSVDTLKTKEIWNTFQDFSPGKNPSLAFGAMLPPDQAMDAKTPADYLKALDVPAEYYIWHDWPDQICDVDWTHENSAHYVPGKGYLVSIRNLNKVILLSEEGKKLWSLGEGEDNDYSIAKDGRSFSMQHSAHFLPDGRIAIYDNHTAYRLQSGFRMGNHAMIFNLKEPGPTKPDWDLLLPTAHSDVRGATQGLRNGNIFTYTAGNFNNASHIFEINPKTSEVVGHIEIGIYKISKGVEAKPFYSFGGDRPLNQLEEGNNVPNDNSSVLEFSY